MALNLQEGPRYEREGSNKSIGSGRIIPVERVHADGRSAGKVLEQLDNASFSLYHVKIIIISGMGFFTDSYDLFCISLLTKMLGRIYYQDSPFHVGGTVNPGKLPINLDSAVSAVALCGTLAGQLSFGALGDVFGRKSVYGLTLAIMIFCALAQVLLYFVFPFISNVFSSYAVDVFRWNSK